MTKIKSPLKQETPTIYTTEPIEVKKGDATGQVVGGENWFGSFGKDEKGWYEIMPEGAYIDNKRYIEPKKKRKIKYLDNLLQSSQQEVNQIPTDPYSSLLFPKTDNKKLSVEGGKKFKRTQREQKQTDNLVGEGAVSFSSFQNILLGPAGRGEEQQEGNLGFKKVTLEIDGKTETFWDLEGYVSFMLNRKHGDKVINGHRFKFVAAGVGDYLEMQKYNLKGELVATERFPLMLEGGLTIETQHETYTKFINPNIDETKYKKLRDNELFNTTKEYMRNNKGFWNSLAKENEEYRQFQERITPTNYQHPNHNTRSTDGTRWNMEGTRIGDYIKFQEWVVGSDGRYYKGQWKYGIVNKNGYEIESNLGQFDLRKRYYILQELSNRHEIAEELWSNMAGIDKPDKRFITTDKEIKDMISQEGEVILNWEETAFTTEEEFNNFLKVAQGPDGKWGGDDDVKGWQKILWGMDYDKKAGGLKVYDPEIVALPGFEETIEWFYSEEREDGAVANVISELSETVVPIELANFESQYKEEIEAEISKMDISIKKEVNEVFLLLS